jgi:DNA-binding GntR family transcriptional regulator
MPAVEPQAGAAKPAVVAAARPPSLAEHVCQVLRVDILSGTLAPGERLTEGFIMERTGVSRTPIREGVRQLEAEGLVVTYRGRGTYVTYRITPEEAALIYDCRMLLEPYLTRLAAERMSPKALASVRDLLERFTTAVDSDAREAVHLDAEFHLEIYHASGSELTSVLRGYWSRIQLELSQRVYQAELPRHFVADHVGIVEALEQRDGALAAERMREHLGHGRRALDQALERDAEADAARPAAS